MDWLKKYVSKKLFVAIATWVFTIVNGKLQYPIDPGTIDYLIGLACMYIFGQSAVDAVKATKTTG